MTVIIGGQQQHARDSIFFVCTQMRLGACLCKVTYELRLGRGCDAHPTTLPATPPTRKHSPPGGSTSASWRASSGVTTRLAACGPSERHGSGNWMHTCEGGGGMRAIRAPRVGELDAHL